MEDNYSLKSFKEKFKKEGIFYTPEKLAKLLLKYVDIDYKTAYDPTCGRGNLLKVLDDNVKKYGQEKNEIELDVAKKQVVNFVGELGDTLEDDKFIDKKFDLIIANYPFSVKWDSKKGEQDIRFKNAPCVPSDSKADYAFLLHMLYHLNDDGIIVTLNFPGILYRKAREGKIRKWLVEQNYIDRVVEIPPNTFEDTSISTVVLVMKKNKKTTDIIFESVEKEKERKVDVKEIENNDFNLSVSHYIYDEPEKIEVDEVELQYGARKISIMKLKNDIEVDYKICEIYESIHGNPFVKTTEHYLNEIKELVDSYLEQWY